MRQRGHIQWLIIGILISCLSLTACQPDRPLPTLAVIGTPAPDKQATPEPVLTPQNNSARLILSGIIETIDETLTGPGETIQYEQGSRNGNMARVVRFETLAQPIDESQPPALVRVELILPDGLQPGRFPIVSETAATPGQVGVRLDIPESRLNVLDLSGLSLVEITGELNVQETGPQLSADFSATLTYANDDQGGANIVQIIQISGQLMELRYAS